MANQLSWFTAAIESLIQKISAALPAMPLISISTITTAVMGSINVKFCGQIHYNSIIFTGNSPWISFCINLDSLPTNASSQKFSKHNVQIMSLHLSMHVNLQLFLRKTAQAHYDLYGIHISHQQVANYARTAAMVIKPFVDHYEYPKSSVFTSDETYVKVRGIKGYI